MLEHLKPPLQMLDHRQVDWSRVRRTATVIHQRFHYEYPGPIEHLRHRLVVFPPDRHGGQRLIVRQLLVNVEATVRESTDAFGNLVCHVEAEWVERTLELEAQMLVERAPGQHPPSARGMRGQRFLEPTRLTAPDAHLIEVAHRLAATGDRNTLVERINHWVWHSMSYAPGVTGVKTTAAEAIGLGQGVCQDYAHIMLAICRELALPARYVSGHLLGEGATHAWVEVLAPDPSRPSRHTVQAFDPTHGRRVRPDYVTVAVGRDYADVAPTSGSYVAPYSGTLHSHKQAGITHVEYHPEEAA